MMRYFLINILSFILFGCASGVIPVSTRELIDKDQGNYFVRPREDLGNQTPPSVFVENKNLKITEDKDFSDTGSLYNVEDERNYLFDKKLPLRVGSVVELSVQSRRAADAVDGAAKSESQDTKAEDQSDEILKSLPNLTPADGEEALIKSLQMKVVEKLSNGDLIVMAKRNSQRDASGNEITVRGRIPYSKIVSKNSLDTNDLVDVDWYQSEDGLVVKRSSSSWEDEYTMRLSGFNEATSKEAVALEDKRKQLLDARKKIENQAKNMGSERRKISKEREDLRKRREEVETKLKTMESDLSDRDSKIKDLNEQLEDAKKKQEENASAKLVEEAPAEEEAANNDKSKMDTKTPNAKVNAPAKNTAKAETPKQKG